MSAKAVNAELAPAGGKIRGSDLLDLVCAHCFIIAAGPAPAGFARSRNADWLAAGAEGKDRVLLGRDGRTILSGRMEVPVLQCCETLGIDVGAEACEHRFADDLSALVDGDFDDFVSRRVGQLPRVDYGIRSRDRQGRANLVAEEGAANERSVG